jgi:N utilization substance protein A
MGCDTAKAVLAYTADEIATRADLEIETVVEILDILKAEFDDDDQ